jgi:hypothetical protein
VTAGASEKVTAGRTTSALPMSSCTARSARSLS